MGFWLYDRRQITCAQGIACGVQLGALQESNQESSYKLARKQSGMSICLM
jgi:hypothetical protein